LKAVSNNVREGTYLKAIAALRGLLPLRKEVAGNIVDRQNVSLPCAAGGPAAWNAILNTVRAPEFFTDAPIPVFPISWQDTGSGVFTLALGALMLGLGPLAATPGRQVALKRLVRTGDKSEQRFAREIRALGRREAALAELRAGEERLKQKTVLLQSTLENIGEGLSVFDRQGRLTAWNTRFVDLFDLSADLTTDTTLEDLLRLMASRGDFGAEARRAHHESDCAQHRARRRGRTWRRDLLRRLHSMLAGLLGRAGDPGRARRCARP